MKLERERTNLEMERRAFLEKMLELVPVQELGLVVGVRCRCWGRNKHIDITTLPQGMLGRLSSSLDTCCLHQVMLLLHRRAGSVVPVVGHLLFASGDAPPSQKAGSVVPVVGHLLFASGDAPPSQKAGSVVVTLPR